MTIKWYLARWVGIFHYFAGIDRVLHVPNRRNIGWFQSLQNQGNDLGLWGWRKVDFQINNQQQHIVLMSLNKH